MTQSNYNLFQYLYIIPSWVCELFDDITNHIKYSYQYSAN